MDRDGTQLGYDLKLIKVLCDVVPVPVIASGGAGTYEHFYDAMSVGADAALATLLFHKRMVAIRDLKRYLLKRDIRIRV